MDSSVQNLFKIGDVARMFHLTVGTLRHYEAIGLLQPEYIDSETKYRYYSFRQFECLNTICYLKTLGLPLERISDFLKGRDVDKMQQLLLDQRAEVERRRAELDRVARKIDNRLRQLEDAVSSELDVVKLTESPALRIALIRSRISISSYLDLEIPIRALESNEQASNVFLGKIGVGITAENLERSSFDTYDLVFLLLDAEDEFHGPVDRIESGECVSIRFRGSHSEASPYYERLLGFIRASGLSVNGFSREITMIDNGMTDDESRFVTEIQIPVLRSRDI